MGGTTISVVSTSAERPVSVPTATYRIQLQPGYPLAAAEADLPHFADLGVSHLHLSPILEAVPGSTHGYDVVDHTRVRQELGGEGALRSLASAARRHGLALVLDIVPNHMAFPTPASLNAPLWELLQEGSEAASAHWFDIDWAAGEGRVMVPVLAGPLGEELKAIQVRGDQLHYGPHRFPLRAGTQTLPLPELLDAQHYRLAWWKHARSELNYRRFFSVSELIAVRVEDESVFEGSHGLVLRLLREGVLAGLRVDHPDGLADPGGYLRGLARRTGGVWTVVEKILTPGEELPKGWPVAGSTGYDAAYVLGGLFTDPVGAARMVELYREFTSAPEDLGGAWEPTVRRAAYEMLGGELAAELKRLMRTARQSGNIDAPARAELPDTILRGALTEMLVRLPVYRSYPPPDGGSRTVLDDAAREAAQACEGRGEEGTAVTLALLRELLDVDPEFDARFAQLSGALRAKSVEDTAFYRYSALLCATEVGADAGRPAVEPEVFHSHCLRTQRDWPHGSTVLTTHDSKRSADVRAALAALTECPDAWTELLNEVAGEERTPAEDPQLAWLGWQTAYGLGEPDPVRLRETLLKSVREAKLRTSWTEPDPDYEEAVRRFAEQTLCGPSFRAVERLTARLAEAVRANSLGMCLLQLAMPGVPDIYQATEDHYRALVDPDNRAPYRRPPWAARGQNTERRTLVRSVLRLRRARPEWFDERGEYEPLAALGVAADHCVSFSRAASVVAVATRLSLGLRRHGGWGDTTLTLPPGVWRNQLDGTAVTGSGPCPLGQLLANSPVALLVRDSPERSSQGAFDIAESDR